MKNSISVFVAVVALVFVAVPAASAAYYFDTNGDTVGFGNTDGAYNGAGLWSTSESGDIATTSPVFSDTSWINFGSSTYGYSGTVSGGRKLVQVAIGSASGDITFTGTWEPTTATGLILNNSGSNTTFTVAINGNTANIMQSGGGVLFVDGAKGFGTHASAGGVVTINSGTYRINSLKNAGTACGLGQGTTGNLAGRLLFNGGKLEYVGGATSTDRDFTIKSGGATIEASGSGTLTWGGAPTLDTSTTNSRLLTLSGSSMGTNTFSGVLADRVDCKLKFTKAGAGKWILTGTNTYTGKTTIEAGTLGIGSSSSSVGPLAVTGTATLDLGDGTGSLMFADSSAEDWTGGTLTLTGTLGPATLRFGTDANGLTTPQRGLINYGGKAVRLDDAGYVYLAPPAGTVIVIK